MDAQLVSILDEGSRPSANSADIKAAVRAYLIDHYRWDRDVATNAVNRAFNIVDVNTAVDLIVKELNA